MEQLLGQSQSAPFMTPLPLVDLSLSINAAWNWLYHLMSLYVQDASTIMNQMAEGDTGTGHVTNSSAMNHILQNKTNSMALSPQANYTD
jgi:hypothetical protein